ncbi:HORMA domain-containing protein 1 [Stegostoma tigrinum]|uniref:HORMA domain-containing protein 1 n=1 Tax=Stegostoma tigrinum TaxID=3053191 RepID=UPI0028701564|nr:HORMA domain-containing protein 1 [Stegostoma tigrinum]
MAVVQMQKNTMGTTMFPSKVTTEQQSLVLVKRLLAVAISCITYLRGLFPEHAYGTRYLQDLCVKILREDDNCPGSSQIVKWMMGCYDALQKKYLRMLILAIYTNEEDPQTITECYQFKFKYLTSGPTMDFASNNKKISTTMSCSDTKKASILLIRKLYVLMQSLGPLPNDICLKMKLSYYDEVTPPDYQPPGFKEGTMDNMMFEGEPVFLSVGEVATPFHVLRVKVTTDSDRMEQIDKEPLKEDEDSPAGQAVELDPNEQVEINDSLPAESPTISQVIVPGNGKADGQNAEAKKSPEVEKTVDKSSPKNNSPASAMENLVNRTSDMKLSGKRTRSGRLFEMKSEGAVLVGSEEKKPCESSQRKAAGKKRSCSERDKPIYQFEVPCSQDEISSRKRKKFSEPKDRFR